MKKARARLPEHLLGRNLPRGREAVPQDVAEVEPTRGAHEDLEHVHLGGAGHRVTEEPTQLGPRELSSPEPRGPRVPSTGDTGTDPSVPSTRVRRLPTFPYPSPWGRPLREMLCSQPACERHAGGAGGDHVRSMQAGRGEPKGAEAPGLGLLSDSKLSVHLPHPPTHQHKVKALQYKGPARPAATPTPSRASLGEQRHAPQEIQNTRKLLRDQEDSSPCRRKEELSLPETQERAEAASFTCRLGGKGRRVLWMPSGAGTHTRVSTQHQNV